MFAPRKLATIGESDAAHGSCAAYRACPEEMRHLFTTLGGRLHDQAMLQLSADGNMESERSLVCNLEAAPYQLAQTDTHRRDCAAVSGASS